MADTALKERHLLDAEFDGLGKRHGMMVARVNAKIKI
jgi:hypothetical protein